MEGCFFVREGKKRGRERENMKLEERWKHRTRRVFYEREREQREVIGGKRGEYERLVLL